MTGSTPRCVVDAACDLGEGPHWHAGEQALYWVDINQRRIHKWDGSTHRVWSIPSRVSALAERPDGGFVVAAEDGLRRFDAAGGLSPVVRAIEPDRPQNRSNDGKVGPDGCFWVGTMADGARGVSGALYRIGADGRAARVLDGVGISNTLAWAPDGRTLYFADSMKAVIWRMAFDPATGALGPRALFVELTDGASPDGSAVDVEGGLWNAQWDGARVVRYRPDGVVDRVVPLPVDRPTSCAFGGADRRTLYITSAREGLDAEALERQPLAGGLFAVDVGVAGCPVPALAPSPPARP